MADFESFCGSVHMPEVLVRNGGFVSARGMDRLEGDSATTPRWLACYQIADRPSADEYIARSARERGSSSGSPYSAGPQVWADSCTTWRAIWRELAVWGDLDDEHTSVLAIGLDAPEDVDASGLSRFDDFYSSHHIGEIMQAGGYSAAVRYELASSLPVRPEGSAVLPRFCTMYFGRPTLGNTLPPHEMVAAAAACGDFSVGPVEWQAKRSRWRAAYRIFATVPERRVG